MKKYIFSFCVLLCISLQAQLNEVPEDKNEIYLKGNALFLPIGMVNVATEFQISKKMTLQPELFISPWKSFFGHEAQMLILGLDERYYFDQAFKHWYIGANFSFARFRIQKWNYWADVPYVHNGEVTPYITSNLYQKGFSFIFGAVGGYQFNIGERWNLDLYLGVGTSQDFYKGYDRISGDRYDYDGRTWNRSGEIIPFKGGLMVSYKL